ncbi:Ubiquitin carboxyl-terminal hydrolase [Penicillium malachiteum]|uniref:Ubiquitin carboxyl-terminal hydrolase n=1 Tax=Penicillium malachiteum TaxID=1324776 RepID=UPI002546A1FE|nr:Ubiquitin carboxyl-terminal hydrolase [Penicillium malachiteum]KAJ5715682.1 Ubiquitin carboxyl-terminal hydrolase [Penicillium malachiteum]
MSESTESSESFESNSGSSESPESPGSPEIPKAEIVDGVKTFIPLENNPEILSHLCKNLGISRKLTFHDILSTSPDLLSLIPRPVHAIILLVHAPIYHATRSSVESTLPEYHGFGESERVIWIKQTIGHACGLMALLHCVFNLKDGRYVIPGSTLDTFRDKVIDLEPVERAKLLYDSTFLEEAHMEAAAQGSSAAPSPHDDNHHHFIGFVQKDGEVWELNGGMNGPLRRGFLPEDSDLLSERGLALTVNDFLDEAAKGGYGEMSIVAITIST